MTSGSNPRTSGSNPSMTSGGDPTLDPMSVAGCFHGRIPDPGGTKFIYNRLVHAFNITVLTNVDIGYILLRAGVGAECFRLKFRLQTQSRWWSACLNLSRSMPVYCRDERSGEGRPWNTSVCAGACMTYAPRCHQLPVEQPKLLASTHEMWPPMDSEALQELANWSSNAGRTRVNETCSGSAPNGRTPVVGALSHPPSHTLGSTSSLQLDYQLDAHRRSSADQQYGDRVRDASNVSTTAMPTAVCLSGQLRVFLDPAVQHGLVVNVHRPGYEYFISTDVSLSTDDVRLKVSPVMGIYTDDGSPLTVDGWKVGGNHHGAVTCHNNSISHFYLFPQMVRFVSCHQMIVQAETRRRAPYAYVMRTRTDLLFRLPFPSPADALARGTDGSDVVLFDDQLSMAAREHAGTILLNPVLAYRECHNAMRWSLACDAEVGATRKTVATCAAVIAKGGTPCSPMNMIAAYAPGPLRIRQCRFLWASTCLETHVQGHERHAACLAVLKTNELHKHHTSC